MVKNTEYYDVKRKKKTKQAKENYIPQLSLFFLFMQFIGVSVDATPIEIKKGYLKMALKLHPDKNGNTEESKANFQKLQHMYTVLSSPDKRARYDELGYYKDDESDSEDDDAFCCDEEDWGNITKMSYAEIQAVLESVMAQIKLDPKKMSDRVEKNKSSMRYKPAATPEEWTVATIEHEIKRINKLGNIYYVYWTKKGISELPETLPEGSSFGCVEKLFLDKNKITTLPSGFFTPLRSLSVLSLEQNKLTVFPECLAALTALKELDLSYNEIEAIPESVGKLKSLQKLNMFANRLTGVPAAVCEMESLVELDLDCNDIRDVPPGLRQRQNIVVHLPPEADFAVACLPPKKKKKKGETEVKKTKKPKKSQTEKKVKKKGVK